MASVSGVLVDLGCNLEDSTMTNLQGHFAVLLVVSAPDGVTGPALEEALAEVAARCQLVVEPWTIAVHGADRMGIVRDVTTALADAGGNVVDLSTHLVGQADAPVYVMTLWVTLPAGVAGEESAARIRAVADSLDIHLSVHRDEVDLL